MKIYVQSLSISFNNKVVFSFLGRLLVEEDKAKKVMFLMYKFVVGPWQALLFKLNKLPVRKDNNTS